MTTDAPIVAVTGASGFLATYTLPWLAARGHRVRAISRGPVAVAGIEGRRVAEGADVAAWKGAFQGCVGVLHLGGRAHVLEDASTDPLAVYRAANVENTRRALEGAAAAGCAYFCYASSAKAVGERTTSPWTEDTPPEPVDAYGISKREGELVVAAEGRRLGVRTVSLRFPLLYGPRMKANMLRLFAAVARGTVLPLGRLHNRRSLMFAGNAAAALEAVMRADSWPRDAYFVSDGEPVSTPELIRVIARSVGRRPRLVPVPRRLFRVAGRLSHGMAERVRRLTDSLEVDSSAFCRDFAFTPPYSMDDGMAETARWFAVYGG